MITDQGPGRAPGALQESDRIPERLLRAARECFEEFGATATRMSQIADRAGIARPNVYRYFPDKTAIILEVLARAVEDLHIKRRRGLRLQGPAAEVLVEALVSGQRLVRTDPAFLSTLDAATYAMLGAFIDGDERLFRVERELWGPLIAYGREQDAIRHDLTDDDVVRWFFLSQTAMFTHSEFFRTLDIVRDHSARFVVPAVLRDPESAAACTTRHPALTASPDTPPTERRKPGSRC